MISRPVNAAFDPGCRRRRPRGSRGRIVGRSDRPSSIVAPNRNITKTEIGDGAAGGPGRSSTKCAAPDSSATTRQGIKNTISPAGNVGERARRRHYPSVLRNLPIVVDDPVGRAPRRHHRRRPPGEANVIIIIGRPDRPSSIVAPNRNNPLKRNGDGAAGDLTIVRPAAAAPPRRPEQVESASRRPASRARVTTTKVVNGGRRPLSVLQIWRSAVKDPVPETR